jgi:hypothetical protein
MVQLRNKNELASLLRKALEIEEGFESMAQWEGYVQAKVDGFRNMMFMMISESEHHASMVTEMLERLGVTKTDAYGLRQQVFDFSLKEESEVTREIAHTEKLALDLYSNIRDSVERSDTSNWLSEEDRRFILDNLAILITDETRHLYMATKNAGKVERIR